MSLQRRHTRTHTLFYVFDILVFDLLLLLLKFLKLWLAGGYCFLHQKERSGVGGGGPFQTTVRPLLSLGTFLFTRSGAALGSSYSLLKNTLHFLVLVS